MTIWSAEIKELEKLSEFLKCQLPELGKELEQLIKADDANVIMLYSRRCLEVIIGDLCESELKRPRKTEPLQGIIDKLNKEQKVPSYILASMHSLNSLATFGTHPKDFDPEQVKPVLINLNIVAKWYLKYKGADKDIRSKPDQEIGGKSKSTETEKKGLNLSRRRLAGIFGGLIGIIGALFAIIYFSNINDKGTQSKEFDKSIAVLPFRNLSNDTTQLYFSEGIVEAILDHLFKVGELRVISSTSTKRFRDTELSIKEIAKELGVASILEGSVQKIGNNVRITAQLIEAKTDVHLWSETYDKDLSDIFSIQTEVAQNVARELKATLTSEEEEHFKKNQTENPEAYNLYLQGRFYIKKRTKEGFITSIKYFEKAVAIDPEYALAYAGLADAYFLLAWYNDTPKPEAYKRATEYANQALRIDKNLAEAHTVLGGILTYNDWKWEEARKELQLAVELNPNFVNAHSYYSELLDILGENTEARKQINIALRIDPFFTTMHALSAIYYYHDDKLKESLEECKKVRELDPDYDISFNIFRIYMKLGEDSKAVEAFRDFLLMWDSLYKNASSLVKDVFDKSGINGILTFLLDLDLKQPSPDPEALVSDYLLLGKKEDALSWLEKEFENPPSGFPRINNNPSYDIVRSEPRFQAIIEKMGLSRYQVRK